jgi:hypothetical protein
MRRKISDVSFPWQEEKKMPHVPVMWLVFDESGYLECEAMAPEAGDGWVPNVLMYCPCPLGHMNITHRRVVRPGTPFEKIEYLVKVVVNNHIRDIGKLFR